MKKGIDISYWQGKVDFSKVSKSVEFVILREGYRMTIDKRFLEYVQGCKGNSIPIHGVYHFCYATSTVGAEEEAASCIANMRKAGLGKDVIVFFDFEYDTVKKAAEQGITLGKSECIAFTKAFCSYVESQGYKAGVYTNLDYYQNMYDKETLDKYILWLADYTGNPDVKCTYQQYTSSGKVPGINGNVDMNYFFGEKQEEEQMRKTAQDVLNVMRSWLGYNEVNGKFRQIIDLYNSVKPLPRGYAVQYHDEWCDTTVSAAGIKAECSDLIGRECGCEQHVKIFQSMGIWIEDGTIVPKPGDIILYNWGQSYQPNNGYSDHIGFVESVSGGQITCIEGNKGEAVARRVISVGNGNIRGYARPRYSGAGTTPSNPVTPPASGDGSLSKNVAWYGVVNTGTLNVRTWAGTENSQLKSYPTLSQGTKVGVCETVKDKNGDPWYYIKITGNKGEKYGFVAAAYITKQSSSKMSIDALVAQWKDQWDAFYEKETSDMEATNSFWKDQWSKWFNAQTEEIQQSYLDWEKQWNDWYATQTADMQETNSYWKQLWATWFNEYTNNNTSEMAAWRENAQALFDEWFQQLKDTLSENVEANLANQILELQERTKILEEIVEGIRTEFTVYNKLYDNGYENHDKLLDSSDGTIIDSDIEPIVARAYSSSLILDSNGQPIDGRVIFCIR